MWQIAKSVLIFLGIPLLAGFLTRLIGERRKGTEWYEQTFIPRISPVALYGLLFTIVILFALQGDQITNEPWDVARIALPLLAYFAIMWFGAFFLGLRMRLSYGRNTAIAFTAAGNNFELAIAVAIGVFGVSSGQALAGVVGPLIEVPVLVGLVYVALWARQTYYPAPTTRILPQYDRTCVIEYSAKLREQLTANLAAHERREHALDGRRHAAVAIVITDSHAEHDHDPVDAAEIDMSVIPGKFEVLDGRMVGVAGGAAFLLCRRASRMNNHPGQWALPGGRVDAGRDHDRSRTAGGR